MQRGRSRQFYVQCAILWALLCVLMTAVGVYILAAGQWYGILALVAAAALVFLTVLYALSARAATEVAR